MAFNSSQNNQFKNKQEPEKKKARVYTTEKINDLLKDLRRGYEIDMGPFYENDIELRAPNILFKMTNEEYEQWMFYSMNIIDFVESEVRFVTDNGRRLVQLRDYQEDYLHLVGDEEYDEELGEFKAKNRYVIGMQSRQSSKCLMPDSSIELQSDILLDLKNISFKNFLIKKLFKPLNFLKSKKTKYTKKLKLYELYYCNLKKDITIKDIILYNLYKVKSKKILKTLIGKLIYFLEKTSYKENEFQEKIIEDYPFIEKIKTINGYNTITNFYKTRPFDIYNIQTKDGLELEAADTHILFDEKFNQKFLYEFKKDDKILTEYGISEVKKVKKLSYKAFMNDFSILEPDHSYLSNGFVSHNTTSTVAYLLWYLIFHVDRNILIVANKGETATEITKKLKDAYKTLPYYLKPGIIVWNQKKILLDNGCSLTCKSGSKTAATGDTCHVLYWDEVSKIPKNIADEFWMSIYPTLSSSNLSQIILTSTPDGKENLFYKIWDGSQKGTNSFVNFRVDWWQVPGHDEEWARVQRANFGDVEFEQEFALSFESSSSKLLNGTSLKFIDKIKKEFKSLDLSAFTEKENKHLIWHPSFNPLFEDIHNQYFLFSVDTAEGTEEGETGKKDSDYNVINIFKLTLNSLANIKKYIKKNGKLDIKDCFRLVQVGLYIDNDNDEEASAEVLKKLVFDTFHCGYGSIDNCRVLIEMNFNGKNFCNKFINHKNYDEGIIIKTYHTKPVPGERQKKKLGYKTTGGKHGKNYYCELGAKKIKERQIIVSQYDKKDNLSTIGQLNSFSKYKGTYQGIAVHDDIAVTVLFSWRAFEEDEFIEWLYQYLSEMQDSLLKKQVMYLLRIYDEDMPEMDDNEFQASYLPSTNSFNFRPGYPSPTTIRNPYNNQIVNSNRSYGSLLRK